MANQVSKFENDPDVKMSQKAKISKLFNRLEYKKLVKMAKNQENFKSPEVDQVVLTGQKAKSQKVDKKNIIKHFSAKYHPIFWLIFFIFR